MDILSPLKYVMTSIASLVLGIKSMHCIQAFLLIQRDASNKLKYTNDKKAKGT